MKHYLFHIWVILFALLPNAWGQDLTIKIQPTDISIVSKNQAATLEFAVKNASNVTYQWYQSTDGTVATGSEIEGAIESSYTTDIFTNREVRYYYCVATAGENSVTSNIVAAAYTGLPILYLDTEVPIKKINKENYVFGSMKLVYGPDKEFTYTFKKEKDGVKNEGVKGRGNSSWTMPKKGYSIKFDKKQSLFDLPASKKWCIIANHTDKTLLRNKFTAVLGKEIFNSEWNPDFISVDVVWNGEYQGNYILGERNVIGKGRINIQDISDYSEKNVAAGDFIDKNGDNQVNYYDGGFVLELDKRDDAEFFFLTTHDQHIALKDPDDVSDEIKNHIKTIVQTAEDALYSETFTNPENGWRKYFDESSAIDWYIVNVFAPNPDLNFSSIYRYFNPADQKIHFGPNWDFDISYGNRSENGNIPKWELTSGWYNNAWIKQMLLDSAFVAKFKNRWKERKLELKEAINSRLQSLADVNSISAECNFIKWNILGTYVWPNNIGAEERTTYQSEIDYMKNYMQGRFEWLDNAIENTFFIYYNLDGGKLSKVNSNIFISEHTKAFTLNNPSKEGYVFAGWSGTGINGLSKTVKITDDKKGDKEFIANWKRDIASCDIVLSPTEFIYNGSAKKPSITITDGEKILVKSTDYSVAYSSNIAVGTAKVTIKGIGDYGGNIEKTFEIVPITTDFAAIKIVEDENGKRAIIDGNYDGTDAVNITKEIEVAAVEYRRIFTTGAYSTIMLPFNVNTANVEGLETALRFNGISEDANGQKVVKMKIVWNASKKHTNLNANTPYLALMNDESFKVNGPVQIVPTTEAVVEKNNWEFRGTWQFKSWDENDLELGKAYGFAASSDDNIVAGEFVKVGVGAWINPMRAYLVNNAASQSNVQGVRGYANSTNVKRTSSVREELPEVMNVIVEDDEGENSEKQTTVIGQFNTRTGEFKMNYDRGTFDAKGRRLNGHSINKARNAYYGKKVK